MSLADHPQAIDLTKRIAASGEGCIPVMVILPVQGPITGSLRESGTPGLFILTAKVDVEGTEAVMDFTVTGDKPVTVGHPNLTVEESKSKIIQ